MTQSQPENLYFLHLNPSNDNHFLVFHEVFARKTCFLQLKTKGGAEPPYPCKEHSPRFAGKIWTRERPGRDARPDLRRFANCPAERIKFSSARMPTPLTTTDDGNRMSIEGCEDDYDDDDGTMIATTMLARQ